MAPRKSPAESLSALRNLILVAAPLQLLIVGSMLTVAATSEHQRSELVRQWPTATGSVKSASVEVIQEENVRRYVPDVEYEYSVAGVVYRSNLVRPGNLLYLSSEHEARGFLSGYPVGATVRIYYNANDPGSSVIDPEAGSIVAVVAGLGALLCGLAVFILLCYFRVFYAHFRDRRKRSRERVSKPPAGRGSKENLGGVVRGHSTQDHRLPLSLP